MPADGVAGERLQKVLAQAGVASRRHCEELIVAGRVRVNGKVITELGTRVDPQRDRIDVDGHQVRLQVPLRYYLLYKPVEYLTTADDPEGRKIVLDLVPGQERLFPVGRLDQDSEGLLLCTNDGELTQRLTHPRYEHPKEYLVMMRGHLSAEDIQQLSQGMLLEDEITPVHAQARMRDVRWRWRGELAPEGYQWVTVILKEGRKRQIRRMFNALGYQVHRLIRVRMGALELGDLEPGQGRWLSSAEASALRRSVGLATEDERGTA